MQWEKQTKHWFTQYYLLSEWLENVKYIECIREPFYGKKHM